LISIGNYLFYEDTGKGIEINVNCNNLAININRQSINATNDFGTFPYYFEGMGNIKRDDSSFIINCQLLDSNQNLIEPYKIYGKLAL
jgi:hypothetical protein